MLQFRYESIGELRKTEGITMEEFSQRIGVSKQVVSTWETGACEPRISSLVKVSNEYGLPLEFFFSEVVTTVVNVPE